MVKECKGIGVLKSIIDGIFVLCHQGLKHVEMLSKTT